jgi:hypothetical protein
MDNHQAKGQTARHLQETSSLAMHAGKAYELGKNKECNIDWETSGSTIDTSILTLSKNNGNRSMENRDGNDVYLTHKTMEKNRN